MAATSLLWKKKGILSKRLSPQTIGPTYPMSTSLTLTILIQTLHHHVGCRPPNLSPIPIARNSSRCFHSVKANQDEQRQMIWFHEAADREEDEVTSVRIRQTNQDTAEVAIFPYCERKCANYTVTTAYQRIPPPEARGANNRWLTMEKDTGDFLSYRRWLSLNLNTEIQNFRTWE